KQHVESLLESGEQMPDSVSDQPTFQALKGAAADHARANIDDLIEWARLKSQIVHQDLNEGIIFDEFLKNTKLNKAYVLKALNDPFDMSDTRDLYFRAYELYREDYLDKAWNYIDKFKEDMEAEAVTEADLESALNGVNETINSRGTEIREEYFFNEEATKDELDIAPLVLALVKAGVSRITSQSSIGGSRFAERLLLNEGLPTQLVGAEEFSQAGVITAAAGIFGARIKNGAIPVALDEDSYAKVFVRNGVAEVRNKLGVLRPLGGVERDLLIRAISSDIPAAVNGDDILEAMAREDSIAPNQHAEVGRDMSRLINLIQNRERVAPAWPVVNLSYNHAIPEAFQRQVKAIIDVNKALLSRGLDFQPQYTVTTIDVNGEEQVIDITNPAVESMDIAYAKARDAILESLNTKTQVFDYLPYGSAEAKRYLGETQAQPIASLVAYAGKEQMALDQLGTLKNHGAIFTTPSEFSKQELAMSPPAASYALQILLSVVDLESAGELRLIKSIVRRLTNQNIRGSKLKALQTGEGISLQLVLSSRINLIRGKLIDLSQRIRNLAATLSSA
ncbi:MAG: hypothetical protein ACI9CF_001931, partial [Candidatus Omnitrophota bacterium]